MVVDLEIDQPSGDGQGGEDEQGDDKDEAVVSALTAQRKGTLGKRESGSPSGAVLKHPVAVGNCTVTRHPPVKPFAAV